MTTTSADDSAWWMFSYKVSPCPIQERHDWSTCPNAHRGERAARRCPRTYSYTPEPCPEYNKTGACAQGMHCPLAHSVFESWLHPSRFRTQLCCFGPSCKRRICFFAHDPSQLRAATHTPKSAAAALAAAATGAPVMRRTQAVVPASMMAPLYPPGAAAAGAGPSGARAAQAGSPVVLGSPAGAQGQQPSPPQLVAGMQGMQGMQGTPWMYTGSGWVPAAPGMGPPVLLPMAGMQQGPMQQQMVPAAQTSLVSPGGVPAGPPTLVPVDHAMLGGLAAGFSGLSLQQQPDLSSGQAFASVPAMLPPSPAAGLVYQPGSGAYEVQAGAPVAGGQGSPAIIYAPSPSTGSGSHLQVVQQQQQQQQLQQQQLVASAMPGVSSLGGADPRQQQGWQ